MLTKLFVKAQSMMAQEDGATAAEYGLLVALIALAIIIGVTAFGGALDAFFGRIAAEVTTW